MCRCPCVLLWLGVVGSRFLSLTMRPRQRPCSAAATVSALCSKCSERTVLHRLPPIFSSRNEHVNVDAGGFSGTQSCDNGTQRAVRGSRAVLR